MNKLNAIYVSFLSLVVALGTLVYCIIGCCNKKEAAAPAATLDAESVKAVLLEQPEMLFEALQKGEEKRHEEMRLASQKLIEENIDEINNYAASPVLGNKDGKITVVEFFDFACGYCHRLSPVLMNIIKKNDDVRLVLKPVYFLSPASAYGAKALYAADKQGLAKEFYVAIMENKGQLSEAVIDEVATKVGMDIEKMKATMDSEDVSKAMADTAELAQKVQVTGVPTLVIEGEKVQTLSESDIQNKINAAK